MDGTDGATASKEAGRSPRWPWLAIIAVSMLVIAASVFAIAGVAVGFLRRGPSVVTVPEGSDDVDIEYDGEDVRLVLGVGQTAHLTIPQVQERTLDWAILGTVSPAVQVSEEYVEDPDAEYGEYESGWMEFDVTGVRFGRADVVLQSTSPADGEVAHTWIVRVEVAGGDSRTSDEDAFGDEMTRVLADVLVLEAIHDDTSLAGPDADDDLRSLDESVSAVWLYAVGLARTDDLEELRLDVTHAALALSRRIAAEREALAEAASSGEVVGLVESGDVPYEVEAFDQSVAAALTALGLDREAVLDGYCLRVQRQLTGPMWEHIYSMDDTTAAAAELAGDAWREVLFPGDVGVPMIRPGCEYTFDSEAAMFVCSEHGAEDRADAWKGR